MRSVSPIDGLESPPSRSRAREAVYRSRRSRGAAEGCTEAGAMLLVRPRPLSVFRSAPLPHPSHSAASASGAVSAFLDGHDELGRVLECLEDGEVAGRVGDCWHEGGATLSLVECGDSNARKHYHRSLDLPQRLPAGEQMEELVAARIAVPCARAGALRVRLGR